MSQVTLDARQRRVARLVPPPSKSDALRLLALAHILDRPDWLTAIGPRPWASDVETFASGLGALHSAHSGGEAVVIDCQDGGAPLRFLLSLAAITPGRFRFVGSARLGARPHAPLLTALSRALGPSGLSIRSGEPWPIEVHATGATGEPVFRVSAAESSQYASSLCLAAAALMRREQRPWMVELDGPVVSEGYLELTLRALRQAGFRVERSRSAVEILAWDAREESCPAVPADWSAIGFLLLIAWRTGGSVAGLSLHGLEDVHPDRAIVDHLHHAGLEISQASEGSRDTRVTGQLHRGVRASAARSPDLIPALAALACLLPDASIFTEISRLRSKESDRLEAIEDLVSLGGASSHLEGDSLHVEPAPSGGGAVAPLRFDARDDHRMIMAAATLAVLLGTTLELRGATGVEKSFPGFFGQLALAGIELC